MKIDAGQRRTSLRTVPACRSAATELPVMSAAPRGQKRKGKSVMLLPFLAHWT